MGKGETGNGNEKDLVKQKPYDEMISAEEENEFELVAQAFDRAGGSRRGIPGFSMERSGWAECNIAGTAETVQWLQGLGFDPYTVHFVSGVNRKSGRVALYPTDSKPEGAVAPRWTREKKNFTWHFGASLQQAPELRPLANRVQLGMAFGKDIKGRDCMTVKLKGAAPKRRGAADAEEMLVRVAEEEAKKAAKASTRKKIAEIRSKQPAAGQQPAPPTEEK